MTGTVYLRQAIGDITEQPRFYINESVRQDYDRYFNHDVYMGTFDAKFMARNRVRGSMYRPIRESSFVDMSIYTVA